MGSKESRDRLVGNAAWYRYLAKVSQPVCCQRNIKKALDYHARCQTSALEPAEKINSEHGTDQDPQRGKVIHSIAERLAPSNRGPTQSERYLRIDVRAMKPRENGRGNSVEIAEQPFRKGTRMPSVRCKCEITIWNLPQIGNPQVFRFVQLLRDSQQCTITPFAANGDISANIHLDEPFFIKATKLLIPVRSEDNIRYLLGQTYRLQISLQPMVYNQNHWQEDWPPVPLESSEINTLEDTDRILHLDAKMDGFPITPVHGSLLELQYAIHQGRPKLDTKYALEVEALWSEPELISTETRLPVDFRHDPPTVSKTMGSHGTRARLLYVFPLVDPLKGEETLKAYKVLGYLCPFCHNRDLQTSKLLQFHLVTDHDLFEFSFPECGDKDRFGAVDLLVEVSDASSESVYDEFVELEPWTWIKPRNRIFSLLDYLNGDDSWITGKKRKGFRHNKFSLEKPPAPDPPIQDENLAPNLPKGANKKFRVPQAAVGGAFFSTLSKRVLTEDELLSESDEDLDESWLKKKHARVIDSFTDLTETEKRFIKRWDDYMFEERILANRYVGDALIRFTRANKIWLKDPDMLKEFFRHATKLLLCNGISHSVVQKCILLVRSTDENNMANPLVTKEMERCAEAGRMPLEESNGQCGNRKMNGRDEDMSASSDAMDLEE